MNSKQENPENVEFSALVKEMEDFGFRPADVARMLNKSPGAISQYLSGYTKPSRTVLELLRRIVKEKHWDEIEPDAEQKELSKKLRMLNYMMHAKYIDIKSQIEALYDLLTPDSRRIAIMTAQDEEIRLGRVNMNPSTDSDAISFTGRVPELGQPQSEKSPTKTRNVRSEAKASAES